MHFVMQLLLVLLILCVSFLLGRMLLKGATAGGVTRNGEPKAYWSIAVAQTALVTFLIYVVMQGRF